MYNKRCRKRLQTAACDEYTEKYSRGRRGAPAKGVGRLPRRESSNLSFSAKKTKASPHGDVFVFLTTLVALHERNRTIALQ